MVSLKKKEFRLINAPFPAPPLLGRMWELWILYSRQYREFCLTFFGGILVRRIDTSKEAFQAYQEFRSQATIASWDSLWPEYETYEDFLFEHESPVVWIGLQQKTEFLQFVSDEYNKMAEAGSEKKLTEMSKEICDKYVGQILADKAAKDEKLGEVGNEIKLIELGPELPDSAKPQVMDFLHRKVSQLNQMQVPVSVNKVLQDKYLMTEKMSRRYVLEYKMYLLCALASKIPVSPSEQTDLVWHTHLCTNQEYPL